MSESIVRQRPTLRLTIRTAQWAVAHIQASRQRIVEQLNALCIELQRERCECQPNGAGEMGLFSLCSALTVLCCDHPEFSSSLTSLQTTAYN